MLGAGALAAAGLRSITAKHLALAAQCVGAVMALHPSLSAAFTGPLPAARRAVLLPDFERVLQVRFCFVWVYMTEVVTDPVSVLHQTLKTLNLIQSGPQTCVAWLLWLPR